MPTAATLAPPPRDAHSALTPTSRPTSTAAARPASCVGRRHWNAPPPDLFPPRPRKPASYPPASATKSSRVGLSISRPNIPPPPTTTMIETPRKASSPRRTTTVTMVSARRPTTQARAFVETVYEQVSTSPQPSRRRSSVVAEVQIEAISRGSPKRLSQVTWTRLQKGKEVQTALESPDDRKDHKKQLTHDQQIQAAAASRRDIVRSANFHRTLKKQDVEAEDVRPLVEIAYWSPFLEVRRDAAAALASLSRNPANLNLLSEVGSLGALLSMLSAGDSKVDPAIARDCAQTLACMAKLDAVKLKILQAPDGVECVFALLHSPDLRLRSIAFDLVNNLVTIEELRQVIAKREGFAFMLESCTSKDSRIRLLAASILNHLAESRENRFLFCHSSHFQTLADILHDPFIERDVHFRRELLSFIHLLVSEEENGRHFVELQMIPSLLLILESPKATHQICVLVVSILEALSSNRKNHSALVVANALPKIVTLCFSSSRGLAAAVDKRTQSSTGMRKKRLQIATARTPYTEVMNSMRIPIAVMAPKDSTPASDNIPASATVMNAAASHQPVVISSETNALLRPAFTVFCEMAKNPANREHVIRSKLVDFITARNLYAASDKRVRRSVITLLTLLICKERERDRADRRASSPEPQLPHSTTQANSEVEFKHYIELLARGVIKCLFGILSGNDFAMKVDAIAAIAQLTEDEHSRLTMCKPQLLRALKEFAFHPLIQTRTNIAKIVANFAERPENILKLVDEGMLAILVKYVCPISRNNDVLVEATRAIAAMSMVHVTRNKLVESGVLGTLLQFCKSPSTSTEVRAFATAAIRNLRHDAAALCIQSIYRGWCVRVHHARSIITRKRRIRKMTSFRKIQTTDPVIVGAIERLADQHHQKRC